ncbi:ATP-dependent acyl-CoA ligase [Diaphorobacter sp. HDW4A]|uniref:AMP-binding protein n=1 Tax=Diaphorobacter sp. HDW4A TaxID=2714924 RepID=UPI00140A6B01|nr:AMP-binding protein [Diaphorobacter sp. HDW4A]QIL82026.1 ATP-dependent acyl-CoA ligase [Diaphorobacter sp. HDW4A]
MITVTDETTIGEALQAAVERYADNSLLAVPSNPQRSYAPHGVEISYREAGRQIAALARQYREAGYGLGHRVALLLESRPEHMLHKLALNTLGICVVPVNPDYRRRELNYLMDHSKVDLVVCLPSRLASIRESLEDTKHQPAVTTVDPNDATSLQLPTAHRAALTGEVHADTPASILYTSGTTGQPKGCVLSHAYELAAGKWYASQPGFVSIQEGRERLFNPLPLFHVNASILSFYCMLLSGGCQIQTDRFQPSRWWEEVASSRASIVHYLGVIIPLLLKQPESEWEKKHVIRFGYGAGVEPQLHAVFEQRFGFPLIELWGMTEVVRTLSDYTADRQVGTRSFGRGEPGLEALVADETGAPTPFGTPGELLVRYSEQTPRKHFFSEYLDDPTATEKAWTGGWFHTGDVVVQDPDGLLHFMDRRKNIIRRSGENIAAAEVEAILLTHPKVQGVAVMAAPDAIREEEVLASIVLVPGESASEELCSELFDFCSKEMAYYKVPGWWWFTDAIPTTGTQKIQKHRILAAGQEPSSLPGIRDLRAKKKRS